MKMAVAFAFTLMFAIAARADMMVDFGGSYFSDTLSTSSTSSTTEYFYNLDLLFNLDHGRRWTVGWTVFGISKTGSVSSVAENYSSMDMGPAFRWNIDKANMYSVTAAYGYLAKGNYTSGTNPAERWDGKSFFVQFAIQEPLSERFFIGLSLNYYAANYDKKIISSVESSNNARKSWIFPMLSMTWRP